MRRLDEFENHPFRVNNEYRAVCKHVVDGDTYDFLVDLGFYNYTYVPVRLRGLDTPELRTNAGKAARERAIELLKDKPCRIQTFKDTQTFGRFVADVLVWDGKLWINIATQLREEGFVK